MLKLVIIVEWIYQWHDIYVRIGNLLLPIISSLNLMHKIGDFIAVHYYANLMQIVQQEWHTSKPHFKFENVKCSLALF
jgi:hypothetical protein